MAAYLRVYDSRHLQAKNWDWLQNPTLGNLVWATFLPFSTSSLNAYRPDALSDAQPTELKAFLVHV